MTGSHCENCFKGVRHEGTPEGHLEQFADVECYVSVPGEEYAPNQVVLFLTDVFGSDLELQNNKLLVDDFARNGFYTVMPDMFEGDPVPADALDTVTHRLNPSFDRERWFAAHSPEKVLPIVERVVKALQARGITKIAATGYCFGARPTFDLAMRNYISASAITHPGRIAYPADLEKYASTSTAPLLINSCEVDPAFPDEACKMADEIFLRFVSGYRREWFAGCRHGFAVRGDINDAKVKEGKEGAFRACVEWFKEKL
ncbi:Dienelactone hydrolase endo-1,3,1,4-beta-D-glucanase [Mycena indigotica]|uniref:Dienelactone hydrolase endo-1,3,1,4-beta-D-glucanase n=1 Tax=Mycena indigotica TaxID=2126181 RepID=A0A8H6TEL2_9AGAR|nr:Dienelactone hydrolase endo-1,3,1,4-beta-D-glucanase [Mycena indigotica]KAF7316065.1 Dienelactone hydrolase endo-1,3,1,4-beta-D-glucanase [Mycena indigotica]